MVQLLSSRSRNTETDGTAGRILNAYQKTTLGTDPNMVKIFGPLENKSTLFSAAINRMKGKSEQQTNDEKRDEKVDGLYYLLVSSSHHPDAAIKNAALSLLGVFENYGLRMKDESYTTESSLVRSLLNDYAQPKHAEAVALVPHCEGYISALETAQNNFENSRVAYEEARGQEGTLENATGLKKEVLAIVNDQLVPYLNVMMQLDEANYGNFARTVEEIISANNETVRKRRKTDDGLEE